ncbi:MAG: mannose-6-phosphate isomerase, partial [Kiritimatiellae bacterium]|nr:mannose-6-phosphate isomerase [Kiritimatiellia bacterium]
MKKNLIPLPPNRVRRNYLGGMILDQLSGQPDPKDGNRPEEWIASTSEACNPGLKDIPNEGLAHITENNQSISLKDLFAEEPEFYLGKEHYNKLGNNLGFLAKLLDSSMRLHLQAHPTAEYAQKHLNSQWGKLETYYILDVRPDCEGYIWLGFQHAPTQEEWNRIVLTQDMAAMHKCFEKVPVKKGEVWVIPGGIPHAIGEGVLVLEVMEPTDLVVRCEFERQGIVVPPDARFMGIDPEQALEIFDLEQNSIEEIHNKCAVTPIMLESTNNSTIE